MNSALKASIRAVPQRTIYAATGTVAVATAAVAFAFVAVVGVPLGTVVSYALLPFALALMAWTVIGIVRLRVVGFSPNKIDKVIPISFEPWLRWWLLIRFGLFGGGLLLILGGVVAAVAHGPFGHVVEAFVCVIWLRIFLDLVFGAIFNVGVISNRRNLNA